MKSLSIIALLSVLVLTGCYPAYQRGYTGYSSSYGGVYGVRSYSGYPASTYYRRSTIPSYSYRYNTPHHNYGHGGQRYDRDWGQNRHGQSRHRRWDNSSNSHHKHAPQVHNRRNYSDHNAAWQGVPHANHYGQRSNGGGTRWRDHDRNRREGNSGRHHGHDGGR
ncbi:hypothetical protein [Methylomonas methanica]|uniref:Lipoprotein n=1 Tax=Methylomonas methanica (strain DSM 25384 / MC09) TaxID=857087 RepID=G0A6F1_METMM|nr:hypothetical protein [Methylomonas methanica]AEG02936.1 hypothetical protein Metme_4598 [Methylomonas methanica MC09]